jgi:hypothetical protein
MWCVKNAENSEYFWFFLPRWEMERWSGVLHFAKKTIAREIDGGD